VAFANSGESSANALAVEPPGSHENSQQAAFKGHLLVELESGRHQ
jgi:hypothetical protein